VIAVYGYTPSGNCWKVGTVLKLLHIPFAWVEVDSNAGGTRTPEFLALNPNAKIPIVVLDDGAVLTESDAILLHFAEGTPLLPPPGLARTRVHEWLFFEQYSHEPTIAVARNLLSYRREAHLFPERMAALAEAGHRALAIMERRLASHDWLAGGGMTVADIALFGYTHVADEGGFDLSRYPGVERWISRTLAVDGVISISRRS